MFELFRTAYLLLVWTGHESECQSELIQLLNMISDGGKDYYTMYVMSLRQMRPGIANNVSSLYRHSMIQHKS